MGRKEKETNALLIGQINSLEPKMARISDADLPRQTQFFKDRLRRGETFDDLLPEAFALVREVAKRRLMQRHFDVQLLGGIALHQGKVAELKTGEGKTLVATLPVYLNALTGKGVHIVTVNDYLARRDAEWMGPIYATLGLSVASIVPDKSYLYVGGVIQQPFPVTVSQALKECSRREAYRADITYGVMAEFGFDYLRDNMVTSIGELVQRTEEEGGFHFALIDEVDSILIDEARTPLIIAAQTAEDTSLFVKFAQVVSQLSREEDYEVDEELRTAYFTESGEKKLEEAFGVDNLYDPENELLAFHAEAALKAHALFTKDKHYVVKNDEIIIVDEFTGRLMYGRRFTEGLHSAIEAKEGVPVKSENKTLATISIQSYFKKYKKLAGMSGTVLPGKKEFEEVYGMTAVAIPTDKPVIRVDHPDRIFFSRDSKDRALVKIVEEKMLNFQPVLIGTRSIEENERLSQILSRAGIAHQILNAKNHAEEAKVIAQAGRGGTVTLATNLAGRGVDILLGGNPPHPSDAAIVKAAGGLVVVGTERHESKRIDDQLRGRAGRQGDPGESVFLVSLDDELVRVHEPDKVEKFKNQYREWPEGVMLSSEEELQNLFNNVQQRVENRHTDMRTQLVKYDTFVGHQREVIYRVRRKLLLAPELMNKMHADITKWLLGATTLVRRYLVSEKEVMVDFSRAIRIIRPLFVGVSDDLWLSRFQEVKTVRDFGVVVQELVLSLEKRIQDREGHEGLPRRIRKAYLATIDDLWMTHMTELETIRAGIDFVSFAGKEPLDEFKKEADEKFRTLLARIPQEAVEKYLKSLV